MPLRALVLSCSFFIFFFNDTATTEIYTLSLHDALPIRSMSGGPRRSSRPSVMGCCSLVASVTTRATSWRRSRRSRSEEQTTELQSHSDLVCRLLLEKKTLEHTKPDRIASWQQERIPASR